MASRLSKITLPKEDNSSNEGSKNDECSADNKDDVGRHNDGSSRVGLLQRCSTKRLGDVVWLMVGMIGECDLRRLTTGVVVSGIGVEYKESSSTDDERVVVDLTAMMELDRLSREGD